MEPSLISGAKFSDERGKLKFNNNFDASDIKRMYIIENNHNHIIRAWQGHKVEQRWFCVIQGEFLIQLIKIDDWEKPSSGLESIFFKLSSENMDVLHVPAGFVTGIKQIDKEAKLLAMADYHLNEVNDEYRFPLETFDVYKNF